SRRPAGSSPTGGAIPATTAATCWPAVIAGCTPRCSRASRRRADRNAVMRLLVLGGTQFLGRHLVELALARGHEVTVFTRGRRDVPRGAGSITGNRDPRRDHGLRALEGGTF